MEDDLADAFHESDRWLSEQNELDNAAAPPLLLGTIESRSMRPEALVALRGAQIAFFMHRYLLKADLDRLLAQRDRGLDMQGAAKLAAAISTYASTSHAAAAALCLLLEDQTLHRSSSLNVEAVAADASSVRCGDIDVAVPDVLRAPVRAQRSIRLIEGATDEDPLFVSEQKTGAGIERPRTRTGQHGLQQLVRTLSREAGLPLLVRYRASRRSAERKWIYDLGLSVQKLRPVRAQ